MAANLHIHVLVPPITEADLAVLFSNTLGSKHFAPKTGAEQDDATRDRVIRTPSVYVGEVSWLKKSLFQDDSFVPPTVQAVNDVIGEDLPVIDDKLATEIAAAFDLPNATGYNVAMRDAVLTFLNKHVGKRVFTISR